MAPKTWRHHSAFTDRTRVGEVVRQQAAEDERPLELLGARDVARRVDELGESRVRHRDLVDGERAERDRVDRALAVAGIPVTGTVSHEERATFEFQHRHECLTSATITRHKRTQAEAGTWCGSRSDHQNSNDA